jgi:hypothetical protein
LRAAAEHVIVGGRVGVVNLSRVALANTALLAGVVGVWCLCVSKQLWADQWAPAEERTVASPNGTWNATMTPRHTEKVAARLKVRSSAGRDNAGGWEREAVNRIAAVHFLVSNEGEVITFGDWHNEGYDHAVVIYDRRGAIVADYTLDRFLTKDDLKNVKASVSSRWWRYDGERPEVRSGVLQVTTSWGLSLRVDTRTGRVSREGRSFARFRDYCEGTRQTRDVLIRVSKGWEDGSGFSSRWCEIRRTGGVCGSSDSRVSDDVRRSTLSIDPTEVGRLLRGAADAWDRIVSNGVFDFDRSLLHLEIAFGDSIGKDENGFPKGADVYWLQIRPTDMTQPSARAWAKRVEEVLPRP